MIDNLSLGQRFCSRSSCNYMYNFFFLLYSTWHACIFARTYVQRHILFHDRRINRKNINISRILYARAVTRRHTATTPSRCHRITQNIYLYIHMYTLPRAASNLGDSIYLNQESRQNVRVKRVIMRRVTSRRPVKTGGCDGMK